MKEFIRKQTKPENIDFIYGKNGDTSHLRLSALYYGLMAPGDY